MSANINTSCCLLSAFSSTILTVAEVLFVVVVKFRQTVRNGVGIWVGLWGQSPLIGYRGEAELFSLMYTCNFESKHTATEKKVDFTRHSEAKASVPGESNKLGD